MKVGLTLELRCPQGSVAFQSQIESAPESIRYCKRELAPGETWVWNVQSISPERIAFFAIQTKTAASVLINETETLLEGQSSTDFGITYARRADETFGTLPFTGTLSMISVTNETDKLNSVDIIFGEL